MKTRIISLVLALAALSLCGCATKNAAKQLAEFERLGITEAVIVGKFSATEYKVQVDGDGNRRAVMVHSNAWLPKVMVVRETKKK